MSKQTELGLKWGGGGGVGEEECSGIYAPVVACLLPPILGRLHRA